MSRTAPFYDNVSSKYGAPMGRHSSSTLTGKCKLQRVPFVDGDYDPGGAYWGGGRDTPPLFCAWDAGGEVIYLRAATRDAAKVALAADHEVTFYK